MRETKWKNKAAERAGEGSEGRGGRNVKRERRYIMEKKAGEREEERHRGRLGERGQSLTALKG